MFYCVICSVSKAPLATTTPTTTTRMQPKLSGIWTNSDYEAANTTTKTITTRRSTPTRTATSLTLSSTTPTTKTTTKTTTMTTTTRTTTKKLIRPSKSLHQSDPGVVFHFWGLLRLDFKSKHGSAEKTCYFLKYHRFCDAACGVQRLQRFSTGHAGFQCVRCNYATLATL
jgi:hypothetical protein